MALGRKAGREGMSGSNSFLMIDRRALMAGLAVAPALAAMPAAARQAGPLTAAEIVGRAHAANGWVRIDARLADGSLWFQAAYDGETSCNQEGPVPGAQASREWSENFGFGIIRFALDPGFSLDRLPDDTAGDRPMHVVRVNDPEGGKTLFGIDAGTFAILWLGFETPRGWHERRYSEFYRNPGESFTQPGRVRLYYDGVKQNEILWTRYALNEDLSRDLFQIPGTDA